MLLQLLSEAASSDFCSLDTKPHTRRCFSTSLGEEHVFSYLAIMLYAFLTCKNSCNVTLSSLRQASGMQWPFRQFWLVIASSIASCSASRHSPCQQT